MTRSEVPMALASIINDTLPMNVTPEQVTYAARLSWDLAYQRSTSPADFRAQLESNLCRAVEFHARNIIRQRVEAKF